MDSVSERTYDGALFSALANAVVHVTREYTGRGPTKARASIQNDMLVVMMQDALTKGEQSLVENGKTSMVLDMRRCYQITMRGALIEQVEALTGRKVLAFMSDNHVEPDMAVEIFVFEPLAAGNGPIA
jgi:uncharacterized protein YbcI